MKILPALPFLLLLGLGTLKAQITLPLWPGTPPYAVANDTLPERSRRDHILRVDQVGLPTLTAYLPPPALATGTAVLICPGGAYGFLAYETEGTQVAQWLAAQGIAGVVLKYRLPDARRMTVPHQVPLADALQGLALIRQHAAGWHVRADRVGIMGFSAGGHLAATVSTHYHRTRRADAVLSRPDFAVLVYPVISTGPVAHRGSVNNLLGASPSDSLLLDFSNEFQVTSHTPPTLLLHPVPDATVPVENSVLYFSALRRVGIPVEMHLYGDGGHGFGMSTPAPTDAWGHWKEDLLAWLKSRGG